MATNQAVINRMKQLMGVSDYIKATLGIKRHLCEKCLYYDTYERNDGERYIDCKKNLLGKGRNGFNQEMGFITGCNGFIENSPMGILAKRFKEKETE